MTTTAAEKMRQLTSLDAQFLAIEDSRNHGHVSSLALYDPSTAPDGELTVERMRDLLERRIHLLPPFRWKLVGVPLGLDHPYWIEDEDFDVEFHVRELALPQPGSDHQLAEQVARLHSRPLDRSHPLWELYVIQGVRGGRVAVMTKMHHSAIDGMSGAEILAQILDLDPDGRDVPPPPEDPCGERRPNDLEMLGRGLAAMPRQPLRALRALPSTLPNLDVTAFRTLPGPRSSPGSAPASRAVAHATAASSSARACARRARRSTDASRLTGASPSPRSR